jgi:hypothetical protein
VATSLILPGEPLASKSLLPKQETPTSFPQLEIQLNVYFVL